MSLYEEIEIDTIVSRNGDLSVIENLDQAAGSIKRMFWIHGASPNIPRGRHRHEELKQIIVCLKGSVFLDLEYQDQREKLLLNETKRVGILLDGKVWRNVIFEKKDSILLVLTNKNYADDKVERVE